MFKSKKKKKTSYSGSDMEKTSAKDFSDDDNLNVSTLLEFGILSQDAISSRFRGSPSMK